MAKTISVLVVDDDTMIREILDNILTQRGFSVLTADNGDTGFNLACSNKIDVILLDWMMAGADGMSVLFRLKNEEKTKKIPVFMLTSKSERNEVNEAIENGAEGYIVKPFDISSIDELIRTELKKCKDKKRGFLSSVWNG